MRSRKIALAGSIAALVFAASPVAAIAATAHHNEARAAHVDRSRDGRGARHLDRSPDHRSADRSIDARGR